MKSAIYLKDSSDSSSSGRWKWVLVLIPVSCLLIKHWRHFNREKRRRHLEQIAADRFQRCLSLFEKQVDLAETRINLLERVKDLQLDEEMRRYALDSIFAESVISAECDRMIRERSIYDAQPDAN